MLITIKANNKYHSFNYSLCGDVREDLIAIFDHVYSVIFDKGDEIFMWAINHNEYYELNKIIPMYAEDMEKSPMWFDSMLLIALIKARYEYLFRGYDFDEDNFEEFKKSRGLE